MKESEIVQFTRSKDFVNIKDIGQGATGQTKLIKDETIGELFVCKKYSTFYVEDQYKYYENFVSEIKILYQINHPNIVRVFNYYLYPQQTTGFIIMEYIDGVNIEDYIKSNPSKINSVFTQMIDGFRYLEKKDILHRDIRPSNILVSNDGEVKIIDFGFGKNVKIEKEAPKSITLNWAYSIPEEFKNSLYDFRTEVYFIGKMFEKIISENNLPQSFKFIDVLVQMTDYNYTTRTPSFDEVFKGIIGIKAKSANFTPKEKSIYQKFANSYMSTCSVIKSSSKYIDNITTITNSLDNLIQDTILEDSIQNNPQLIKCFISGLSKYKRIKIEVSILSEFTIFWKSLTNDKKMIVLSNLWGRFNTIDREVDDLPF